VTNTGATQIKGNLGVSPGTAVVGFPPGTVEVGTIYAGDAVAAQAQADLTTAYDAFAGLPCKFNLTGHNLGGLTLTPGVYCFDTSAELTGTLVLDFQNSTKSSFVFQIGSTLTTASSSAVSLANCTQHCGIFWQVGSSATLGTSSKFSGNIMAKASITITTDVVMCGRALAETGAVTMDTDIVFFMGSLTPPIEAEVTGNGQVAAPAIPGRNPSDPPAIGTGSAKVSVVDYPTGNGIAFGYRNVVTRP
jgi:type VI secretion system secreted protein VgrG